MSSLFKFLIRITAFLNKELAAIFRQPMLIFVLVLGPFLIMLLFGLGYPDENRALRTIFVMDDQDMAPEQAELFTGSLGSSIQTADVGYTKEEAIAALGRNKADLVIVVPAGAVETIQSNQRASFLIYHNEIDPFQIAYIRTVAGLYVEAVNGRILESAAHEGQGDAGTLQASLDDAISRTETLRQGLPPGDTNTITQVDDLLASLNELNEQLIQFRSVSSSVLVNPFTSDVAGLAPENFNPTDFFAPAVIVLLLQHLSITLASLSIVRERRSGITELFRISPMTAFELLVGKFLAYLLFEIILGALILGLIVGLLGIPMYGNWRELAAAVLVLLYASLGLGFLISLISNTDTQAVQFSMLLLLASIFFSGFLLDLRLMWEPMALLAWSLPATYGIQMLQDIMLRGAPIPVLIFAGLAAIGTLLFLINWMLLRRKIEVQYSSR